MASLMNDLSKLAITGVRAVGAATLESTIGFSKAQRWVQEKVSEQEESRRPSPRYLLALLGVR